MRRSSITVPRGPAVGRAGTSLPFRCRRVILANIFAVIWPRQHGSADQPSDRCTNRNDFCTVSWAAIQYDKDHSFHASLFGVDGIFMVSSNFERLLFDMHGRNGLRIAELMATFKNHRQAGQSSPSAGLKLAQSCLIAGGGCDMPPARTIAEVFHDVCRAGLIRYGDRRARCS